MTRVARSVTHSRRGIEFPAAVIRFCNSARFARISSPGLVALFSRRRFSVALVSMPVKAALLSAPLSDSAGSPALLALSLSHTSASVNVSPQTEPALSSSSQRPASAALLSANCSSSSRERRPWLVTSTLSLLSINLEGKEEGLGRQHSGDTI